MVLSRGELFPEILVNDLMNKVKGNSSLAVLSKQTPISFNGNKEFVFSMDKEVDIVAEGGQKSEGGISLDTVIMVPLKIEYGARVTDEFLYASEEYKLNILKAFNDGYAKKVAKGLDLMAFHGINPRTGQASTVIGDNFFDKKITQTVVFNAKNPDENIESAVGLIRGSEGDVTGAAFDPTFATGYNQVYLRCETYLGWGILDPNHFAIIKEGESS